MVAHWSLTPDGASIMETGRVERMISGNPVKWQPRGKISSPVETR